MSSVSHDPTSGMCEPKAGSSDGGWGSVPVEGTAGGSTIAGDTAAGRFMTRDVGVSVAEIVGGSTIAGNTAAGFFMTRDVGVSAQDAVSYVILLYI